MKSTKVYSGLACLVVAIVLAGGLAATARSGERAVTADPVTLTFWDDIYTDDASAKAQQQIARGFEKLHPNVKVNWVAKPFTQFVPTAKLALSGKGAPDLVICAYGETCNGDLVRAHLVIPTDKYAKKYGWFKNVDPSLLPGLRFTKDGKWGSGETYGRAETYDLVGAYYNKQKLAKLGLKVPKTLGEFEKALAKAKAAGEVPIQLGDLEKSPLAFVWMSLVNYFMPSSALDKWIYHKPGGNINTPGAIKSVETLKRWSDLGYISPDVLGVTMPTAMERFNDGTGLFAITGAWYTGGLTKLGKKASFVLLPPRVPGGKPIATHTFSNPVMITSRSKNPDLAAEFLDYLTGPKTAQIRANVGMNTTSPEAVKSVPTSTGREVLGEFKRMIKTGRAVSFLDVTAPGMLETLDTGLQNVLGGKMSPQDFLKKVQAVQQKAVH